MQIKVCGLTQPENVVGVLDLGVDYIGLIFYAKSKRYAAGDSLQKWLGDNEVLFTSTKKVGVFVNAEVDTILNAVHDYQLDYIQLHGNESADYCQTLQLLWSVNTLRKAKIIKAFGVDARFSWADTKAYERYCELFIFDTGGQAQRGGTGKQWDWQLLEAYRGTTPFLLSGGIGPDDAAAVQRIAHPAFAGVDLNSRFEKKPGVKDVPLLRAFVDQVRTTAGG